MQIWDTLIVGAGPAGAAAAFDLARAGRSVLLLDHATFPRPKACAAGLTIKTLRALRYSVAPVTHRTIRTIRLEGPGAPPTSVKTRDPICVTAVREEFDNFCLNETLAAGAQLQRIGRITSVLQTGDLVTLRTATQSFQGRYLLGADGANSQIRKFLHQSSSAASNASAIQNVRHPEHSEGSPDAAYDQFASGLKSPSTSPPTEPAWLTRGFALETHIPLPADVKVPDLLFDFSIPNGYAWIFPKRDHLNVGLGFFDTTPGPAARAALTDYIRQRLHQPTPAKVVGQYLAFGFPQYTPTGRILLAGDAAGTLDPLTAEGIYPAITSGQAAAQAIHNALTHAAPAAPQYLALTKDLRAQLSFSARAARRFYQDPSVGLRALRLPIMRHAIVRTYALGLARPALLPRVARYALKLRPGA